MGGMLSLVLAGGVSTPLALVVTSFILEFLQTAIRDLGSQGPYHMPASAALRPPLDLPPPYALVTLRESKDAYAHACRIAEETGAGTFVWVRRFDLVEFAVVLEPEEPLLTARRAFLLAMTALADAIASSSPPEKPVTFEWPDTIRYDGARLGGGRLGWPPGCQEDDVPRWLVFSAMLIASKHGAGDPGLTPESTSLEEEGFDAADGQAILESFARYLMLRFDTWAERGFGPVAETYLARLPRSAGEERRAIDRNGDLVIRPTRHGETGHRPLLPALAMPSWLDAATGVPRL